MSTDAPGRRAAATTPEMWDVARVRHVEDDLEAGRPGLPGGGGPAPASGELAAYSVLQYSRPTNPGWPTRTTPSSPPATAATGWACWSRSSTFGGCWRSHPAVERVITFNAAENDHMLAINVALGFRPAGYDGEWQRPSR